MSNTGRTGATDTERTLPAAPPCPGHANAAALLRTRPAGFAQATARCLRAQPAMRVQAQAQMQAQVQVKAQVRAWEREQEQDHAASVIWAPWLLEEVRKQSAPQLAPGLRRDLNQLARLVLVGLLERLKQAAHPHRAGGTSSRPLHSLVAKACCSAAARVRAISQPPMRRGVLDREHLGDATFRQNWPWAAGKDSCCQQPRSAPCTHAHTRRHPCGAPGEEHHDHRPGKHDRYEY